MRVLRMALPVAALSAVVVTASGLAHAAPALSVVDVARQAGIAEVVNDNYADTCVGDLNGDGLADLVLSRHLLAPPEIFMSNGNGTYRLAQQLLPITDRHDCGLLDVDGDGDLDLVFAVGAEQGRATDKHNEVWINNRGTFTQQPGFLGVSDPSGRGRVMLPFNADGKGLEDLLVGNAPPEGGHPSVDHSYVNVGGRLVEQARAPFPGTINALCGAKTDYDGDGLDDPLLCLGKGTVLWHNDGNGHYTDAGLNLPFAQGATFGDVNGDGHDDLVLVSGTALNVYLWKAGTFAKAYSMKLTAGHRVAIADVDGDGHADLYVVQGDRDYDDGVNQPDVLLLGDGTGRHWTDRSALLPQVTTGGGNDVAVLHYQGKVRLLVTNGGDGNRQQTGPRQLLEFRHG